MKTSAEIWLNRQGPDFYQDGLNKLVLRSDKCLNRLGFQVLEFIDTSSRLARLMLKSTKKVWYPESTWDIARRRMADAAIEKMKPNLYVPTLRCRSWNQDVTVPARYCDTLIEIERGDSEKAAWVSQEKDRSKRRNRNRGQHRFSERVKRKRKTTKILIQGDGLCNETKYLRARKSNAHEVSSNPK
ncbi:hypothetical protein TNCV_2558701 [Trichonephila clavipes]|nr:hypothetical protein TNCV_2558701 [Trichonephila clavipes]